MILYNLQQLSTPSSWSSAAVHCIVKPWTCINALVVSSTSVTTHMFASCIRCFETTWMCVFVQHNFTSLRQLGDFAFAMRRSVSYSLLSKARFLAQYRVLCLSKFSTYFGNSRRPHFPLSSRHYLPNCSLFAIAFLHWFHEPRGFRCMRCCFFSQMVLVTWIFPRRCTHLSASLPVSLLHYSFRCHYSLLSGCSPLSVVLRIIITVLYRVFGSLVEIVVTVDYSIIRANAIADFVILPEVCGPEVWKYGVRKFTPGIGLVWQKWMEIVSLATMLHLPGIIVWIPSWSSWCLAVLCSKSRPLLMPVAISTSMKGSLQCGNYHSYFHALSLQPSTHPITPLSEHRSFLPEIAGNTDC